MHNRLRRIRSYDALRGICAIGILFSHMSYLANSDNLFWSTIYLNYMKYGSRCTSFFFIMSGFLIAYTWKDVSFQDYVKEKIRHLYPLTILVFFLAFVCSFISSDSVNDGMRAGEPLWIWSLLLNPLLLKAYVPIKQVFYSFHGPSWYISALFGLYITAYLIIRHLNEKYPCKANRVLGLSVLAVYTFQLFICIWLDKTCSDDQRLYWAYINPYFRILGEGMFGVWLCWNAENLRRTFFNKNVSLWESIAILLFALDFAINNFIESSIYSAWIQAIPMGFLIIAFYGDNGIVSSILHRDEFQFLAKISFELYMTHAFVYEGLPIIIRIYNRQLGAWLVFHAGVRFIVTVPACILVAWIFHRIFSRDTNKQTL